jgi:hypothetical protein
LNKNRTLKPSTGRVNKRCTTKYSPRSKRLVKNSISKLITTPAILTKPIRADSDSGIDMSDARRLVKKAIARNKLSS